MELQPTHTEGGQGDRKTLERSVVLCLLLLLLGCGGESDPSSQVESPAAALQLTDLDGRVANPFSASSARITVAVFVQTDCPITNRYAPLLHRLQQTYEPRGVVFLLVYADPTESPDTIRKHLADYGHTMPAWRDTKHHLLILAGARVAPEAAVFVSIAEKSLPKLVYCGRIDNQFVDLGVRRPEPTEHDLIDAIEAVLAGNPVKQARTPAIGCVIQALP